MSQNIPLFKVFMDDLVGTHVNETLASGYIGQGSKVDEFEKKLSDYLSNPYVNTVNSATSGLHLAIHLVKKLDANIARDEVITTPLTCLATNFPILANNLKIKWADLDPSNCNIDLDDVKRKIGPKTLALMVTHWGGNPCNLNKIKEIKKEVRDLYGHDLYVIEDCAHALGSKFEGKMIGNSENICVFSFQAIKHLTTGDGGLITSPIDHYHKKFKLLRWYGLDRTSSADFRCEQNVSDWGFKFHMNDIAASIGLSNFPHLCSIVEKHQNNHSYLQDELKNIPGITTLNCQESESACWIMTLLVENREGFIRKMKSNGIDVSRVHDRNDKHDCLKEFKSFLPTTDKICEKIICIPCGWWVTKENREFIVNTIKKGW